MKSTCFAAAALTLASTTSAQAFQKTEFQSKELRPPVWMIGEYYVVSQTNGDQYLYVIPTVYNKISEDNPYNAKNGSIMQMYAQFETLPRGATPAAIVADEKGEKTGEAAFYESWTCNMKYFTDITNKTKDDIVETIFYEGTKLISSQRGTFSSANNAEQVETSAWKNDPELSLIKKSSANAVGDKYMIYQCGMYRQFNDKVSAMQLKTGAEIPWIFGYKVYETLGRF